MKKRFPSLFRRTTALLCALSLTVPAASAASSQYEEILQTEQQIVDGLTYYNTIASTKGGRIESYLLEMEKDADVSPMLMSADGTIYGGSTISSAVQYAREQGHHVLAAINTDFFSSSSGVPMGIVIQDGVYQSSPEKEASIVINDDGKFEYCAAPEITMTLTNERTDEEILPHHFNKLRNAIGGMYLLNDDFSTVSTRSTGSSWYVLMKPVEKDQDEELTVDCELELEVIEKFRYDQAIAIREGEYILTADDKSNLGNVYASFEIGDRITLTTECDDRDLRNAVWASGCGDLMIDDRELTDTSEWTFATDGRQPRTALGVKKDGTVLLYAVDGRRTGHSAGMTQKELAEYLLDQGCKWAVNLDGGGSTAISLWVPGQSGTAVQNRPSDGRERNCASYLLLVAEKEPNGRPDQLAMTQNGLVVLEGSSVTLPEVVALDRGLEIVEKDLENVKITSKTKLGSIEDGVYTAEESGTDTLRLSWDGLSGTAAIHVVDELTELTVTRENGESVSSLTMLPGETVRFDVTGSYWGRPALRDLSNAEWAVEGDVGTIDEEGTFTAAYGNHSGSIAVSAGGMERRIEVTVESPYIEVSPGHWAFHAVRYCNGKGILYGVPEETFNWDSNITRAEFVLSIYNVLGKPEYTQPCTFTDVSEKDYYYDALCWGQELGIANGMGDGTFLPGGTLTREQAFALLRRAMPQLGVDCQDASTVILAQYADAATISEYAKPHIATLTIQGLVNGMGSGVEPLGNLTWAQTAALLYRLSSFVPVSGELAAAELTALCTAGDRLNVRLAPDTASPALAQLPGGTTVVVTETLEGWYKILYPTEDDLLVAGYASADYLALQ